MEEEKKQSAGSDRQPRRPFVSSHPDEYQPYSETGSDRGRSTDTEVNAKLDKQSAEWTSAYEDKLKLRALEEKEQALAEGESLSEADSTWLKEARARRDVATREAFVTKKQYREESAREIGVMEAAVKPSDVGDGNPGEAGTDEEAQEDFSDEEREDFQIVRVADPDEVERRRARKIAKSPTIDLSIDDNEVDHLVGESATLTAADLLKEGRHSDDQDPESHEFVETTLVHVEDYPDGVDCRPMPERIKNHGLRTFLQKADPNFLPRVWENASKIEVRTHPVTGEIQLNIQSSKGHLVIDASDFSLLMSVPEVDDDSKRALSFPQAIRTKSGRFEIPSTVENQFAMRKFFGSLRIGGRSPGENLGGGRKTGVDFKMWYRKDPPRVATLTERNIALDNNPRGQLWNDPPKPGW